MPPPVDVLLRQAAVEELLVSGTGPTQVAKAMAEKFGVSERQVWTDIAAVRTRWAQESAEERPRVRAELLAQVNDLYHRCREGNDHKIALGALQLKADLHGLRLRSVAAIVADPKPESLDAWLSRALGLGAVNGDPDR